jgi:hypothetical protein
MPIFQLAYLSKASPGFNEIADIDEILKVARSRNKGAEVTGIMIYREGWFVQLLEGDAEKVKQIYGSIASDIRHRNLSLLVRQRSPERIFPDWSMAFYRLDAKEDPLLGETLAWRDLLERTSNGEFIPAEVILKLLQGFRFRLKAPAES